MRKLNLWKTLCLTLIFCAGATIASPANTFTSLVSFNGTDGTTPYFGTLVQGLNGALYGTTSYGGTNASGTVFKLTVANTLTAVHSFDGGAGGAYPQGGLDQGTNGVFYGTTEEGGTNSHGTIFQITPAGAPTTLYNFCSQSGCTDGAYPRGWLVHASNGKLYGTTQNAGSEDYGTVFSLTRTGTLTTLHSFHFADGAYPIAGLVEATNGIFYGTTESGGTHSGGTVFKITPTGKLTTLYDFCSQSDCADGENPYAGLIQATDGNFYGTTYGGGINGVGTIFEITDDGTLSTLYDFCSQSGCADGENPLAGLVQATNGKFYGTTSTGGTSSKGTIFSLATGLKPFVGASPTSGPIGTEVKILGYLLTGATSVTFNGTPATFTVVRSTEIETTVPSGATTGPVVVTTPFRTLTSNVNFIVN
jgi:uncharacterized repeat protein (TIGR03803 family)